MRNYLQRDRQLPLNPLPPRIMHVDVNSCFATIEQQANPQLRDRPVAVAAYTTPRGCILAASVEAKKLGIKTGMRVAEGKKLCPELAVLLPDPPKYRYVNRRLVEIFRHFTPRVVVKSIDEAVLDLTQSPLTRTLSVREIGREIKREIGRQIGENITVSVGVGTNYFWAKTAADWRKPDGLTIATSGSWRQMLAELKITQLCGIGSANAARLAAVDITTPVQFLDSPLVTLKAAFQSVIARYWYLRLRGWEVDETGYVTKTVGHSYALPQPTAEASKLNRLLHKLAVKTGRRLRRNLYQAGGVRVACQLTDHSFWQKSRKLPGLVTDSLTIFRQAGRLLTGRPAGKKVVNLAVNCFDLVPAVSEQLPIFAEEERKRRLTEAVDEINSRYGEWRVLPAAIVSMEGEIVDRVAFGRTGPESPPAK